MKSYHVSFVTLLGNGHVYPVIPLCSELVKRGYRVTFVTSSHYAPYIEEVGGRPITFSYSAPKDCLFEKLQRVSDLNFDDDELWSILREFQQYQFAFAQEMVAQVKGFYGTDRPDLVIYDAYAVGGRLLAHWLGCPAVRISPHFAQYENYLSRDEGSFRNPPGAEACRTDLDSFLATQGIETSHNMWYVETLNIHLIPRAFQYCESYFDDKFCFAGALLNRPIKSIWKRPRSDKPVVLVSNLSGLRDTFAASSVFLTQIAESLSDSGVHCILSIGDDVDPRKLGHLPRNCEVNTSASHLEILPHSALSICHGGMLSTLEAIYHAVPVLAIPSHYGTREVSFRTAELGVGRSIARRSMSIESVRTVVHDMLNDTALHHRVLELRELFRQSGGEVLAADMIEASVFNSM